MSPSQNSNSPFPAWQSAMSDAQFSDTDQCTKLAGKFERQIRIRNFIEYGAGAFVLLLFGATTIGAVIKGDMLIAFSMAVTVAGVLIVLWGLWKRASNLERRPEDPCITHLRRQYQRQFEALSAVPLWYLGPLIPGMALFFFVVTFRVAQVAGWSTAVGGILQPVAIVSGIFGLVALVNWIAARSIKRKIEAIDALA